MTGTGAGYRALTTAVAVVEMPRDVLAVEGPEARSWLQGQLSQDVDALDDGGSALAFLLEPTGRPTAPLRVTRLSGDSFLLDCDPGLGDAVTARLNRFRLRVKADVNPRAWRCLAVRGPAAATVTGGRGVRSEWPWPVVGGWDLLGDDVEAPDGLTACPLEEWEAARIEAGLPAGGRDVTEKTIPAEAGGLVAVSVSFTKGCYTGQELVARVDARGSNVPRPLRLVHAEGPVAAGDPVVVEGREVGVVTSAAVSPANGPVALAAVKRDVRPPAQAEVVTAHGSVAARLSELPTP